MAVEVEKLRDEVERLVEEGKGLSLLLTGRSYLARLADKRDTEGLDAEELQELQNLTDFLSDRNFSREYQAWYSTVLPLMKRALPERYEEFVRYYSNDRRKKIDVETYSISDHIKSVRPMVPVLNWVDRTRLLVDNQIHILESVIPRLDSIVSDIRGVIQADLFDTEIEAAEELASKGYGRAAGAIAGVVLEKHLAEVAATHGLKTRKRRPTISTWNDLLKENSVIPQPEWRRLQLLGDLRNKCVHDGDDEPSEEDVDDLIDGVKRTMREVPVL